MIETLPGFLLVAGLILFVFSLFTGPFSYKHISIPALSKIKRIVLSILGCLLFAFGGYLYAIEKIQPLAPVLTPEIPTIQEAPQTTVEITPSIETTYIYRGKYANGQPNGSIFIGCGSPEVYANTICSSNIDITVISTRSGDKCGYTNYVLRCVKR